MFPEKEILIQKCRRLLIAYKQGKLGCCVMPEDSKPHFPDSCQEERLVYFTLPMSLNYQRDSYKLWQAALSTYLDNETRAVFSVKSSADMSEAALRKALLKYRLALQPNKHINTWKTISQTINDNWGMLSHLLKSVDNDFLRLKEAVQIKNKKDFPYLSGPKIFNYWSFIISTYGKVRLKNSQYIDIAPDTHIIKCSVLLGLLTKEEASSLPREKISFLWRHLLEGSGITPIEMHAPLWFWSRNDFLYKLD